jgi:hypothetical protein
VVTAGEDAATATAVTVETTAAGTSNASVRFIPASWRAEFAR